MVVCLDSLGINGHQVARKQYVFFWWGYRQNCLLSCRETTSLLASQEDMSSDNKQISIHEIREETVFWEPTNKHCLLFDNCILGHFESPYFKNATFSWVQCWRVMLRSMGWKPMGLVTISRVPYPNPSVAALPELCLAGLLYSHTRHVLAKSERSTRKKINDMTWSGLLNAFGE